MFVVPREGEDPNVCVAQGQTTFVRSHPVIPCTVYVYNMYIAHIQTCAIYARTQWRATRARNTVHTTIIRVRYYAYSGLNRPTATTGLPTPYPSVHGPYRPPTLLYYFIMHYANTLCRRCHNDMSSARRPVTTPADRARRRGHASVAGSALNSRARFSHAAKKRSHFWIIIGSKKKKKYKKNPIFSSDRSELSLDVFPGLSAVVFRCIFGFHAETGTSFEYVFVISILLFRRSQTTVTKYDAPSTAHGHGYDVFYWNARVIIAYEDDDIKEG